ncbi:MAG TPA: oxygenase MpaB family protein, partial [Nocardioidaceae bacterium]|nr:oxygenase MpaB family protein [Nocardioidaceae bacterium]
LSGNKYDANDPQSQLWIHLTAWHSILFAYERFGPGKLSAEEESRYWDECARAAELQTCDPADVPRTREGIAEYFEHMRPKLAGSEAAQKMMAHLLRAEIMMPPMPLVLRPGAWVVGQVLRAGTISTMPQWMRRMAGLRQWRIVDLLVRPVLWIAFHLAHLNRRAELLALRMLSPMTVPVVAPVLLGVPPTNPVTMTPSEAQALYGYDPPARAHLALRAKQAAKVFEEGTAPSDEGIRESEPILGATG